MKTDISFVFALCLLFGLASTASAQTAPAAQPGTQPAAGQPAAQPIAPTVAATRSINTYPPNPRAFMRGNVPPDQNSKVPLVSGFYLSLWRFIPFLGLYLFWTWCTWWVDDDSNALRVRNEYWNSIVCCCGLVGFLVAFCLPKYILGISVLVLSNGLPLGLYIKERNSKVPESAKVMTPQHIRAVTIRGLARIGIHIGSGAEAHAAMGPDITFIGKSNRDRSEGEARTRQVENSKGYMAAKELVYDALLRRATDIHLEPKEGEVAVRLRIDGVMYGFEAFDRALGDAVVNIFKVLGAMDITEKRKSLDGSFRAETEGREIDFRVATQGTRQGEKMSLRILDQANSVSTIAQLGFRKQFQEQLTEIIHQPHGLLLVCGPTGAGKSTTLFAALNEIDSMQRNIITVEDPVEYKMDSVTQIEINRKAGQTFATVLRSILRQDPDVVMLGEIRDEETAVIACQAANTGHMVFSTVHANDTITALYRMLDLGVEPFMFASSVSAILAQRLARRLCSDCREAYKPKAEFLKKANLPAEKITKFYRTPKTRDGSCPACADLGYRGRVGVYELLGINDRMRDMIREKASLTAIKAEARKNGMLYMKEEGLRLVVKGVTSIDELLRVVK